MQDRHELLACCRRQHTLERLVTELAIEPLDELSDSTFERLAVQVLHQPFQQPLTKFGDRPGNFTEPILRDGGAKIAQLLIEHVLESAFQRPIEPLSKLRLAQRVDYVFRSKQMRPYRLPDAPGDAIDLLRDRSLRE
jgi:hypothetical protein